MLINQNSIVKDRDFDPTISLQNALAYIHLLSNEFNHINTRVTKDPFRKYV